jgi:hypothetical protein
MRAAVFEGHWLNVAGVQADRPIEMLQTAYAQIHDYRSQPRPLLLRIGSDRAGIQAAIC